METTNTEEKPQSAQPEKKDERKDERGPPGKHEWSARKQNILCMVGVEKHYVEKDLIKFLRRYLENSARELPVHSVHKKRGTTFAFLNFASPEQMKEFSDAFASEMAPQIASKCIRLRECTNYKKVDSKQFKAVRSADTMLLEGIRKKENIQKACTDEDILKEVAISIETRVMPYHHLAYDEQIKRKSDWLLGTEVLTAFSAQLEDDIKKQKEYPPGWYRDHYLSHKETGVLQPVCPLNKVIRCDEDYIPGYRNKVEFTIGRKFAGIGKQGPVCIGFNQGNMSKGILFVDSPDNITVIPQRSIKVAKSIEKIIQDSGVEPYNRSINKGFWRILLYRESKKTKQCMISIVASEWKNQTSEDAPLVTESQLQELKDKITQEYKQGDTIDGFTIQSVSMIFSNEMSGGYVESDRFEILSGSNVTYEEDLLGFKFKVSPFAFFQVNTNVFEKMLNEIASFLNIDKETVVFDICCGTGAIGICLSNLAKKVLGFELVEAAVVNARENVDLNKDRIEQDKCEFHAGRAEYLLPEIAKQWSDQDTRIVGIVDPPRSGLHRDVLRALRCCKGLNRLVYVSCNAVTQMRDMQFLCYTPEKRRKAPPFKPIGCIGADLFPNTSHVESIIFFERDQ